MECQFPTINSDDNQIKELFKNIKNIAIVGLSPDDSKDSNKVAQYLKGQGYKIIPIYPKEEYILGEKVYRSLSEVDEKIDLVDVFRKPDSVCEIVDEILKRDDIKALWLQIGVVNNEQAQRAKDSGLMVVQSRCTMIEHKKLFGLV
ncbi:MAG: CoA-binding protein [Campylobacterales bacterium]|nr:CoA-binding protein [Campylobacterales bacterium]